MTLKEFPLLVLSIGLVACTSQETPDNQPFSPDGDISVDSPFIYKGTRASGDIDSQSITRHNFKVWGYDEELNPVLAGTEFSWTGASWVYSPTQKWEGRTITFAALAPTEDGGIPANCYSYDKMSNLFTISGIPAIQEISNEEDNIKGIDYLVAEVLDRRTQEDGDLQFSFHHILSKLQVFARYQTSEDLSCVKITKMQISLPEGTATYSQKNQCPSKDDSWALPSASSKYCDLITEDGIEITSDHQRLPKAYFLAPNTNTSLKMNIEYECYDMGGEIVESKALNDIDVQGINALAQGQIINLYVTVMYGELGTINFRPQVGEWSTDESNENSPTE